MAITNLKSAFADERLTDYGREWIQQLYYNRRKLYKELLEDGSLIALTISRQVLARGTVKTLISQGEAERRAVHFAMHE